MLKTLTVLKGKAPGPKILLLVGTHGNEYCGVQAIQELLPKLNIERGQLTVILANPKAHKLNKRFVDTNLNRLFLPSKLLSAKQRQSYEYSRQRIILPRLKRVDIVLDIHSSATPNSQPFVICGENSIPIIPSLGVQTAILGWDDVQPGGTDGAANRLNKLGICLECGFHDDPASIQVAKTAILGLLSEYSLIASQKISAKQKLKTLYQIKLCYKTKVNFKPKKDFEDFEEVKKNQVIGLDGTQMITARSNGFVIFVRARAMANEEAFLFGIQKRTNKK